MNLMTFGRGPVLATVATLVALSACGGETGSEASERDRTTTPTPSASTTPNPWAQFRMTGLEAEQFANLRSMVRSANVTVLGTVLSGGPGERINDAEGSDVDTEVMIDLEVRVDEVLAGTLGKNSETVTVTFGPVPAADVSPAMWRPVVGEQSIFALRRAGAAIPGLAKKDPRVFAQNIYYVVYSKGLIDEEADKTAFPTADQDGFARKLRGQDFDTTLQQVRAAAR